MKLLVAALSALVSITLAIPLEQATTNVAIDCPVRPQVGPVSASLCADVDWAGYCHVFVTCEGSCFDLVDYGVLDSFGDGVSSVMFPVGQECKFFSGRECDWTAGTWDGSYWGQRDVDTFTEGPNDPQPRHPGLNNKIRSFVCSHGSPPSTAMVQEREEPVSEVVWEHKERSPEVLEKRAIAESAEIASKSPSSVFF